MNLKHPSLLASVQDEGSDYQLDSPGSEYLQEVDILSSPERLDQFCDPVTLL